MVHHISNVNREALASREAGAITAAEQARMAKLYVTLSKDSYDITTITSIRPAWVMVQKLGQYSARTEVAAVLLRHEYLSMYMLAFHWLEGFVNKAM